MIKIIVNKNEEVVEKVTTFVEKNKFKNGSLSLIGAVDSCCISTMPKDNAKEDILTQYDEPFELSGTGEIVDGKIHIHVVLGRENKAALFGHLHWGRVETWFVHIYFSPLDNATE